MSLQRQVREIQTCECSDETDDVKPLPFVSAAIFTVCTYIQTLKHTFVDLSTPQHSKMSTATSKVIDTYELLEQVIIRLPPIDIARSMRVSKAWQHLITRSVPVQAARILAPAIKLWPNSRSAEHLHDVPLYKVSSGIRFYPSLPGSGIQDQLFDGGDDALLFLHTFEIDADTLMDDARVIAMQDRYVTTPPCQALLLSDRYAEVVVYVKEGIRIHDLQDLAANLKTGSDR